MGRSRKWWDCVPPYEMQAEQIAINELTGPSAMAVTPLDTERVLKQTFIARVEHHPMLDSTNDRAKELADSGSNTLPLLVIADRQTAGRGRGGNRWWTGDGSLACSLLLDIAPHGIQRELATRLSLVAGLAVVETVAPLLHSKTVGLHWPNDVFAGGRKLAGILVEGLPSGLYVIGIGLNTNNTMDDAPPELRTIATTLRDLTGSRHDPTSILVGLLRHIERMLRRLASAPEEIGARSNALCLQHGQLLTLAVGDQEVRGRCLGIASDGALVLETPRGQHRFYTGILRRDNSNSPR